MCIRDRFKLYLNFQKFFLAFYKDILKELNIYIVTKSQKNLRVCRMCQKNLGVTRVAYVLAVSYTHLDVYKRQVRILVKQGERRFSVAVHRYRLAGASIAFRASRYDVTVDSLRQTCL